MSRKRIINDANFFDDEPGDIIDKLTREQEYLDKQKEESPLDPNAIIDFYHKKLYENPEALNYLEKLGLKKQANYERFKVGFSDEKLINSLSKKQIEQLKNLGLIREDDKECFDNCIIFPIFNEIGKATCIYGFDVTTNEFLKPIYLDKEIPIFNEKATKVYDEVILTENILEALSLIELDIENVISINDSSNITARHIKLLQDNRVKTIVLAIKNEITADILKDLFIQEGFSIKVVFLHKPLSSIRDALQRDEITKAIIEAEIFKPEEEKGLFRVKKDNGIYTFITDEVIYHLAGVKDIYQSNTKVQIKAEVNDNFHRDKIDIYTYRARQSFANDTASKLDVNSIKVEKELDRILDYLEKEREKRFRNKDKEEVAELTEEERELGLSLLKSPDLFQEIVNDMTTLGYVGEEINKKLLYLCATSRLMDDPISVLIISQSASGKSYLVETTAKLIPEDEVIDFNTVSRQALQYMGDRLLNKFMIMGEAMHDPEIEHQIREILSGHKLSRYVVVKNDKTGELTTEKVLLKANASSVLTTTNNRVNPENASRYFIANADESREQTRRIYESQKHKYSEERENIKKNIIPEIIKKHQAAQRLLRKITIVFPGKVRERILFPDIVMRLRRDHERFIDLIAAVCFLRQYQKEIRSNNVFEYIECDSTDYRIAYDILMNGVLPVTVSELPRGAIEVHEELKRMAKETAKEKSIKPEEVIITQRDIREYTGFSHTWIKFNLRILVDYEYVELVKGGKVRSKGFYRIKRDEEIEGINFKMIPTPEEIERILKGEEE